MLFRMDDMWYYCNRTDSLVKLFKTADDIVLSCILKGNSDIIKPRPYIYMFGWLIDSRPSKHRLS